MSPLIITNFVVGGMCLAVAMLQAVIFIRRPESKAELFFALLCLSTAASVCGEVWVYQAIDVNTFLAAHKVQIAFQGLQWIFLAWFIAFYTGATRRWPAMLVTGIYAMAIIGHLVLPYGILYSTIDEIHRVRLAWGETIAYASGSPTIWRFVADSGWVLLIYLAAESCVRLSRRGNRGQAFLLGTSLSAFLGLAYLHDTLMDFGIAGPPSWNSFAFLALILVMSGSLSGELLRASALSREVAANEKRWRSLIENVNLLAIGVDARGRISYVNPYFEKVSGYAAEEALGRPIAEYVPKEERQELLQRLQAAREGMVRPHSTRALLTKGRRQRHISWFHVIERETGDQISGILSIGEDITELRKARRALEDEKSRMDIILSSLNTGLALINEDMTVAWVNGKTQEILSWEELIGKVCYEAAAKRDQPCEGCGALEAFSDGQIHETERQSPVDGKWHQIVSLPIKDDNGRVIQVLEATTDISERKRTEEARDRYLGELEELKAQLEGENIYLRQELQNQSGFDEIVGESNSLLYVLTRVQQVAETDASVLIQGETGVGKELVARAIHQSSPRAEKPFIKLNCAALPTNLVESELFGHEKGAFTGAEQLRKGRFELADGGTLLLDEISELPPETQAKLLRVLQESQFERVGGSHTLAVDVRIIATTNRNLKDDIIEGGFRSDLYYRLNVYPITVPPLRTRLEDIPLLVQYFVTRIASRMGKKIDQVPPHVMARLQENEWPGNVRELRNVLEQAVIHSPDHILQLPKGLVASSTRAAQTNSPNGLESLETVEKEHILKALDATGWRISGPKGAAIVLGINPSTLRFRMKKLGISKNR